MKLYRTRKNLHNRHVTSTTFGMVKPVYVDFALPGDVWKLKANCLIRCQPMLAPSLTQYDSYFRFFFVPLRLVLDKCEEIITGSKEGSLITSELPKAANFVKEWLSKNDVMSNHCAVHKDSFYECLGVRPSRLVLDSSTPPQAIAYENYDAEEDAADFEAAYFYRAYCLIIWHYFRDENYQSFDGDFEKFYEYMLCHKGFSDVGTNAWYVGSLPVNNWDKMFGLSAVEQYGCRNFKLWFANLSRDYFMDTLPWIMKGTQPTINAIMHADFSNSVINSSEISNYSPTGHSVVQVGIKGADSSTLKLGANTTNFDDFANGIYLKNALNKNTITDGGFTAQDIRDMFAETRVFERLARTGSRYVEYLKSNFGIAPADDTLQRPVYLGGFSQPIVTTEVVQNGGDTEEVGTLRGHGISSGGNSIRPYVSKEFGIIFCLQYIKPRTQYLYQMRRKFTYKSRFDFFNPSFQLLSEQQTKNLEFFIPKPVLADDDTGTKTKFNPLPRFVLGYNRMYEELRKDSDLITGEMADTYAFWTSAINPAVNVDGFEITSTPPINGINICLATYMYSLLRPWKVTNGGYRPFFIDFGISGSVYRPIVKNPQPGLVDHL